MSLVFAVIVVNLAVAVYLVVRNQWVSQEMQRFLWAAHAWNLALVEAGFRPDEALYEAYGSYSRVLFAYPWRWSLEPYFRRPPPFPWPVPAGWEVGSDVVREAVERELRVAWKGWRMSWLERLTHAARLN